MKRFPDEPTTFLLDQLTGVVCLVFAARLVGTLAAAADGGAGAGGGVAPARVLWMAMFLALAAAAVTGGIKHGYFPAVDTALRRGVWRATFYSGGLATSLLVAAAILLRLPPASHLPLLGLVAGELVAFLIWVSNRRTYRSVMLHYVPTAGAALAILLLTPALPLTPWVVGALVVAALAGLIQVADFKLHRHFNHNDLAHVISLGALWLLYRAGLLIGSGTGVTVAAFAAVPVSAAAC